MFPLKVDGVMGSTTIKAAWQAVNEGKWRQVLGRALDNRDQHYIDFVKQDPSQKVFLKGWFNRAEMIRRDSGLPKKRRLDKDTDGYEE